MRVGVDAERDAQLDRPGQARPGVGLGRQHGGGGGLEEHVVEGQGLWQVASVWGFGIALAIFLFIREQIGGSVVRRKIYGNQTFSRQVRPDWFQKHRVQSVKPLYRELVRQKKSFSREEIRSHISGNYCRCTGYQAIVDAIEEVTRSEAAHGQG